MLSMASGFDVFAANLNDIGTLVLGYVLLLGIFWLYFSFVERDIQGIALKHGQQLIYGHLPLHLSLGLIANVIHFALHHGDIGDVTFKVLAFVSMTVLIFSLQLIRLSYIRLIPLKKTIVINLVKVVVLGLILLSSPPRIVVLATCIVVLAIAIGLNHHSRKSISIQVK